MTRAIRTKAMHTERNDENRGASRRIAKPKVAESAVRSRSLSTKYRLRMTIGRLRSGIFLLVSPQSSAQLMASLPIRPEVLPTGQARSCRVFRESAPVCADHRRLYLNEGLWSNQYEAPTIGSEVAQSTQRSGSGVGGRSRPGRRDDTA